MTCCLIIYQGKKNPGTDSQSVKSFLNEVKKAKEMKIDRFDSHHCFFLHPDFCKFEVL